MTEHIPCSFVLSTAPWNWVLPSPSYIWQKRQLSTVSSAWSGFFFFIHEYSDFCDNEKSSVLPRRVWSGQHWVAIKASPSHWDSKLCILAFKKERKERLVLADSWLQSSCRRLQLHGTALQPAEPRTQVASATPGKSRRFMGRREEGSWMADDEGTQWFISDVLWACRSSRQQAGVDCTHSPLTSYFLHFYKTERVTFSFGGCCLFLFFY